MKKTKIMAALLSAAIIFTGLPISISAEEAHTDEFETALSLNTGAAGLGVDKLKNPSASGSEWEGSVVSFGDLYSYPMSFRVLDMNNSDGILLDSEYALFRDRFQRDGSVSWNESDLANYLNRDFLSGHFSESEQKAMAEAGRSDLSGNKVFLLSEEDINNKAYGYGADSTRKKNNLKLTDQNKAGYYLRDTDTDGVKIIDEEGKETSASENDYTWVSPSILLKSENVVMTWPAFEFKPEQFSIVNAENTDYHCLTITAGQGFAASRKDSNPVPSGSGFTATVTDMGTPDWGIVYSHISAILVDKDRNIIAYGPVSSTAGTGEVFVEIPSGIPNGDYTVKLFAEDMNSVSNPCAIDYASNVIDLPVTIGDFGDDKSETVADPGETSKSNAPVQADTKKDSSEKKDTAKKNENTAPAAVSHTITVTVNGNGQAAANITSAVSGTLVTLTAVPASGNHLKSWSSQQVQVAADNTFTMPNQDVTVTANFEQDAAKKYNVNVIQSTGGTISANPTQAAAGDKVTVNAVPNNGYVFVKWNNIITDQNGTYFIMPSYDVNLSAVFQQAYSLTVTTDGNGSATFSPQNPLPGQTVTLFATPGAGYHFSYWDSAQVTPGTSNQFVMPQSNVIVKAVFEKDAPTTYSVTAVCAGSSASGGTVTISGGSVHQPGDTVYVDVGYLMMGVTCTSLTVTDSSGRTSYLSPDGDYFVMPSSNVAVTATFEPLVNPYPDPNDGNDGSNG